MNGTASLVIDPAWVAAEGVSAPSDGASYWQYAFANGNTLAGLVKSLAMSVQATTAIDTAYASATGAPPDPAGLAYWQWAFANGNTLAGLTQDLAWSASAAQTIDTAWQNITGASAPADGINYWTWALANGGTLASLVSDLAYSPQTAAAISTAWMDAEGVAAPADGVSYWQWAFSNGNTLSGLQDALAYSAEAAAAVNTAYQSELGRPIDQSGLDNYTAALAAGGQTLQGEVTAIAYSAEASADISSTFQTLSGGTIDPPSLEIAQANLASEGNVASAVGSLLTSPTIQDQLTIEYTQVAGSQPTAQELGNETSSLQQAVDGIASLSWANIFPLIGNAALTFLNSINPIGSAEAATSPSQQAANLAIAQNLLANTNIVAFLHAISAAEHYNTYDANNYSMLSGDKKDMPTGNTNNFANFPTNAHAAASASGAYAIVRTTWQGLSRQLGLTDFHPASQDLAAAWNLYTTGAATALLQHPIPTATDFAAATYAAARTQWAAVPGGPNGPHGQDQTVAGYATHQHAVTYATFQSLYAKFGGQLQP